MENKHGALLVLGAVLLLGSTFVFAGNAPQPLASLGQTQAAATVLGDAQGAPPGYTGHIYPDQTLCFYKTDSKFLTTPDENCWRDPTAAGFFSNPQSDTFYSGVFSVSVGSNSGETQYLTTHWTAKYDFADKDLGPATASQNCFEPFSDGNGGLECSAGEGGYYPAYTIRCDYSLPAGDSYITPDTYQSNTSSYPPECEAYKTIPVALVTSPTTAGSAPTVAPGQPVTLQWSCLPNRTLDVGSCNYSLFDSSCHRNTTTMYSYQPFATGSSGTGAGFAPSGTTGTQIITAPATPGTYNYSLTCTGFGAPAMTIPLTVAVLPPTPTVAITGNGQGGTTSATPGQVVHIVATFSPPGSFTGSAINDFQQNALTSQDASSPKTYDFNTAANPAAPGTYIFWGVVKTAQLGWANNFGKSLTITVAPLTCPGAHQINPPVCTCDVGYTMQGGQCIPVPPPTCPGAHEVNPPACNCDVGYSRDASGQCVLPPACSDPNAQPPLCTSCKSGFTLKGGSCVLVPTVSLNATPTRVQKGKNTALTWSATNLGAGINCTVTSNPAGVFSTSWDHQGNSWSGTNVPAGPIASQTTLTLACTNATPVTISVNLLPTFQEI